MLVFNVVNDDDDTGEEVALTEVLPISFKAGLYNKPLSGTFVLSSANFI